MNDQKDHKLYNTYNNEPMKNRDDLIEQIQKCNIQILNEPGIHFEDIKALVENIINNNNVLTLLLLGEVIENYKILIQKIKIIYVLIIIKIINNI